MLRRALLPCLLVLVALPVAGAPGAGPIAHAAKRCGLSSAQKGGAKHSTLGPTYVLKLSARHVSCRRAKRIVKAFHECRHEKHRKTGRCGHDVRGFSCSEDRTSSDTQYDSVTTCRRGSKRVKHTYTQNR